MRISDWSSDVCSSDLQTPQDRDGQTGGGPAPDGPDLDGPDLDDLARRYVDLWQDQVSALAADPEFAESLQKVMAALGIAASGLPALWSAWPAALGSLLPAARPAADTAQQSHGEPADAQPGGK